MRRRALCLVSCLSLQLIAMSGLSLQAAPIEGNVVAVAVYTDIPGAFGIAYDSDNDLIWYTQGLGSDFLIHSLKPFKNITATLTPTLNGVPEVTLVIGEHDVAGTTDPRAETGGGFPTQVGLSFDPEIGQIIMVHKNRLRLHSFDPFTGANLNTNYRPGSATSTRDTDGLDVEGSNTWFSDDVGSIWNNGVLFADRSNPEHLPFYDGDGNEVPLGWSGVEQICDDLFAVSVQTTVPFVDSDRSRTLVKFDPNTGGLLGFDPDGFGVGLHFEDMAFDGQYLYAGSIFGDANENGILGDLYVFEMTGGLSICTFPECDPDPLTQGYWHRQCLGAGLITVGRNVRGPQFPNEPDFDKLLPNVSAELGSLIFEFRACEDGILVDPPSDSCEKAKKQFTALLFNADSGRLQDSCEVDVSAEGCSSTNIGDLIGELAALINTGDSDNCKTARDCAEAVNEGNALLDSGALSTVLAQSPFRVQATAQDSRATYSGGAGVEAAAVETSSNEETAGVTVVAVTAEPITDDVEEIEEVPEVVDDVQDLQRHLAVLANAFVPEKARASSTDALLTALSGGYELETRIEIVKGLVDHIDASLLSLLSEHVKDIRDEARDFNREEMVAEADRLLEKLQPLEE